jgi:hypothetical protein
MQITGDTEADRHQEFNVRRLVANSDYVVSWPHVAVPQVQMWYRDDWQTGKERARLDRQASDALAFNPFDLAWSLEERPQFLSDLLASELSLAPEKRPSWTTETATASDGSWEHILKRTLVGDSEPDLAVTVDPDKDYVVTRSEFTPHDSEGLRRIVKKSYQQVAGVWCLSRMEQMETTVKGVDTSAVYVFDNIKLSSNAPDSLFTLAGLDFPERVFLTKMIPNGEKGIKGEPLEYTGGDMLPVDDPNEQHMLLVELGIIPLP